MPWLNFLPESLYWGVRLVGDALGKRGMPVFVSENGCACDDAPNAAGEILDLGRILYTRAYLRSAVRAIGEGLPLVGYFHWSLMDNFEWPWGYSRRFGITYVDYATQARIPKQSFRWYQNVIAQNAVV
jgi:beta-glucosidase